MTHHFAKEQEMIPCLARFLDMQDYVVEKEVDSKVLGTPDLVGFKVNYEKLQLRNHQDQRLPLDSIRFHDVLSLLRENEPLPISYLQNSLGISYSYLKNVLLRKLKMGGYVYISRNGVTKINGFLNFCEEIVTIEAKLYKWRIALYQAIRNKFIAHKSYIAVPESSFSRLELSLLSNHNIGLLIVSSAGNIEEVISPQRQTPSDIVLASLFAEELWRRHMYDDWREDDIRS